VSYLPQSRPGIVGRSPQAEERAEGMENNSQEVRIYKNGDLVATSRYGQVVKVPMPLKETHKDHELATEELTVWTCFHMPKIKVERMFLFRILNGMPLSQIFNGSGIEAGEHRLEPLYYIHGRVEVLRGNTEINSVLLGHCDREINIKEFVPKLPALYRRVAALL
jgi:hypothetical protein